MNQIDPVYVIKLIEASKLLKPEQKEKMKAKLSELDQAKLAGLVVALEKEQTALTTYFKNIAHVRKVAAEKKVKAYYEYAETAIEQKEQLEIDQIEAELSNI